MTEIGIDPKYTILLTQKSLILNSRHTWNLYVACIYSEATLLVEKISLAKESSKQKVLYNVETT